LIILTIGGIKEINMTTLTVDKINDILGSDYENVEDDISEKDLKIITKYFEVNGSTSEALNIIMMAYEEAKEGRVDYYNNESEAFEDVNISEEDYNKMIERFSKNIKKNFDWDDYDEKENKLYIKRFYPDLEVIKRGDKIVLYSPSEKKDIGSGNTEKEAWKNAKELI
jgi:hypothetical protein